MKGNDGVEWGKTLSGGVTRDHNTTTINVFYKGSRKFKKTAISWGVGGVKVDYHGADKLRKRKTAEGKEPKKSAQNTVTFPNSGREVTI